MPQDGYRQWLRTKDRTDRAMNGKPTISAKALKVLHRLLRRAIHRIETCAATREDIDDWQDHTLTVQGRDWCAKNIDTLTARIKEAEEEAEGLREVLAVVNQQAEPEEEEVAF